MKKKINFEIEKGIDLPSNIYANTIKKMDVGDSFFVPIQKPRNPKHIRIVIQTEWGRFKKKTNSEIKISTRLVDDGIRVWRVE